MRKLISLIFLFFVYGPTAFASVEKCNFTQAELSESRVLQLSQHCKRVKVFCENFEGAQACGSPQADKIKLYEQGEWNKRYRQWSVSLSSSADQIVNDLLPVQTIELKKWQLEQYYEVMGALDQLSRSQDPSVKLTVAHVAQKLQLRWMDLFGDVFYRWMAYDKNISNSTGPLVGYMAGSYIINTVELNAQKTSSLFRYIRFKLPVTLLSYTLPFAATKVASLTINSSKPMELELIPPSPAHLIRFEFNRRDLWNEFADESIYEELLQYETRNQLVKDSVIAAAVLVSGGSSGNMALRASTAGQKSLKALRVLRLTPMSFAVGIGLEVGLSFALDKYEHWQIKKDIVDQIKYLLADKYLHEEVRNQKRQKVVNALNTYEVFNLAEYREKIVLLDEISKQLLGAHENSEALAGVMQSVLSMNKEALKQGHFIVMKEMYCSDASLKLVIRSRNVVTHFHREAFKALMKVKQEFAQVKAYVKQVSDNWGQVLSEDDHYVARALQQRQTLLGKDMERLDSIMERLRQLELAGTLELFESETAQVMIKGGQMDQWVDCKGYVQPLVRSSR